MPPSPLDAPSLTIAIALIAGILAQSAARHLRIPGIVLLLGIGVLLGPDLLGVIRPSGLGGGLRILVGFAVAVILFEGGMGLRLEALRRAQKPLRRLVTLGALLTAIGCSLAAWWLMGWDWRPSVLFGTLMIVTGPTVINPLLRRLRIKTRPATLLEAEGILGDAVGAIVAAVALEIVIAPSESTLLLGLPHLAARLGFGALFGGLVGLATVRALGLRGLIPEGMENIFTLALALGVFQGANAVLHESGIAAAIAAGLVVGNAGTRVHRELVEFKEQLTVLFIGLLFVLLAADVRLAEVQQLGWPGVATVAAVMLLMRPLVVLACTAGSDLGWRERIFVGCIGPRGIVAAAVASLFAAELDRAGVSGGGDLRALVFLVIAVTVVTSGLAGGPLASALGVRRPRDVGWILLGANELGRLLGRELVAAGEEVVCIDSNPEHCQAARREGLYALNGNGIVEGTLQRAPVETRAGAGGVTPNDEVNLRFVQRVKAEAKLGKLFAALATTHEGVTPEILHRAGAELLFGGAADVDAWCARLRHERAAVESWHPAADSQWTALAALVADGHGLPLTLRRGDRCQPAGARGGLRATDQVGIVLLASRREQAARRLEDLGWRRVTAQLAPAPAA